MIDLDTPRAVAVARRPARPVGRVVAVVVLIACLQGEPIGPRAFDPASVCGRAPAGAAYTIDVKTGRVIDIVECPVG